MTRLFLRFYIGVLLILFAAWYVQAWVSRYNVDEKNARVVVRAMAGAVRVSRDWLNTDPTHEHDILEQIRMRFEFPVNIFDIDSQQFPSDAQQNLRDDDEIVLYVNDGLHVAARLANETRVVSLGPLPSLVGPEESAQLTGLGVILVIAAALIAILLRPVARQLREVESTATAIAGGDLSARIHTDKVPQGRSLATAFNAMAARIQALLKTQQELLQAVSHDLRTPLAKMRFAIDLISTAKSEDERATRLESLDAATEELDGLVDELLNYVRIDTAEPPAHIESIPVLDLVETLVAHREDMYPQLSFDLHVPSALCLRADRAGLQRVVANLLGNSCRFADRRIKITGMGSENVVRLTVEDDGPGIPVENRERVLDPFVRIQSSDENNRSGVGLGLALVARIVSQHSGQMKIDDSDLGGCRIQTVWPV